MTIRAGRKIKNGLYLGIACALACHFVVFLFGGMLLPKSDKGGGKIQQVDLLDTTVEEEIEKPQEAAPEVAEAPPEKEPELVEASLGQIEAALSGLTGSGDFAEVLNFSPGGQNGAAGAGQSLDQAFSLSEIDQKPRVISQAPPVCPAVMRKTEGSVYVMFVVDQAGRVSNPRVEKSSHPEFEKPALEAVKQWKFEPAIKAGQRVACKMRIPIRFQPR